MESERAAQFEPEAVLKRRWIIVIALAARFRLLTKGGFKEVTGKREVKHAYHTLTVLFVPLWRRYHHRRVQRAIRIMTRFIFRCVLRRRFRNRNEATERVKHFLRNKHLYVGGIIRMYVGHVLKAQSFIKRHLRLRAAQVEMNKRKVQSLVRQYWIENHVDPDTRSKVPQLFILREVRIICAAKHKEYINARIERDRRLQELDSLLHKSGSGSFGELTRITSAKMSLKIKMPSNSKILTKEECFTVLDGCCRTIAAMDNDMKWSKHLRTESSPTICAPTRTM